jgi:uncharacterized membrane protein (DUF4010 family)
MDDSPIALRLLATVVIGLVVGAERERRKQEPNHWVPAGIRTFALSALLGGVAAYGGIAAVIAGAVLVNVHVLVARLRGATEEQGITTEVALLSTYALGAFAQKSPLVALGAGLVVSLLLASRERVHKAATDLLTTSELIDVLTLAVAAIVVLPLVPNEPIEPLGVINPYRLAKLAVTMMAITGAGYVAERWLGPRHGLSIAGLASGFVSSSATIGAMGTKAKEDEAALAPAAAGAAASSVATFVQMSIVVGMANPALLRELTWPLVAGGVTALAVAIVLALRAREAAPVEHRTKRAFSVRSAVLFAGLIGVVLVVSTLLARWLGEGGALFGFAVGALADAHAAGAAVASLAQAGGIKPSAGVLGVMLALSTNSITKVVIAFVAGSRKFALWVASGVVLALAASWAAWLIAVLPQ